MFQPKAANNSDVSEQERKRWEGFTRFLEAQGIREPVGPSAERIRHYQEVEYPQYLKDVEAFFARLTGKSRWIRSPSR